MGTLAGRQLCKFVTSSSVINGVKCLSKCSTSTPQLLYGLKVNTFASNVQKARCLTQFAPLLQTQTMNNFPLTSAVASALGDNIISKSTALRLAISESEVTSTEDDEEDDDATIFIQTTMNHLTSLKVCA